VILTNSARALLQGIVDYAGMFPPATLPLEEAAAIYARYRAGADAWMVGTFVVSAEGLDRLDPAVGPISVVTPASAADVAGVLRPGGGIRLAAIEFRPIAAREIAALASQVPREVEAFFEIIPDGDLDGCLDAIASCGRFAKLRTGGITADAFPGASAIYRFLRGCAERDVAAKATAGLHHAITGRYRLTYDAASVTAPMYGFLNICAAAALVHQRVAERDVLPALSESSADAFRFDDLAMEWRGHRIATADLKAMRETLFRSFGSCSLQEPLEELRRMRVA
jgi:hypothetical protein